MKIKKDGSTFFYVIMMLALVGIITSAMMSLVLSDTKSVKVHREKQQDYYTALTICEALADSVVDNNNDLVTRFEEEIEEYVVDLEEYEAKLDKKEKKVKPNASSKKPKKPPKELEQSDFSYSGINTIENNETVEITTVLDISPLISEQTTSEEEIQSDTTVMYLTFTVKYMDYELVSKLKTETNFLTIDDATRPKWKEVEFYEK